MIGAEEGVIEAVLGLSVRCGGPQPPPDCGPCPVSSELLAWGLWAP